MQQTNPQPRSTWIGELLTYGPALLLAPLLGLIAAAIAAWHALLAGSIWYLPLGLLLFLASFAVLQTHKWFDLALLGLVTAGAFTVLRMDAVEQGRHLDAILSFTLDSGRLVAVLLAILTVLAFVHLARQKGGW